MNAFTEMISDGLQTGNFTALGLDALVKSFAVMLGAGGLCVICRRASAATRHLIWFVALGGLPCLVVFSALPRPWHGALWSVSTAFNSGNEVSVALELAPATLDRNASTALLASSVGAETAKTGQARKKDDHPPGVRVSASWVAFAVIVWGGGALLSLISVLASHLRLGRLSRQAVPLNGPEWEPLLSAARQTLRLWRPVRLMESPDNIMPLTWGWRRAVVLLPADAAHWPLQRRRLVLLHELAHVKRWDCLTQTVAQVVRAFFWVNPLVWLAARRMCVEREHACDDLVLNGGCKATDYATDLVEIARSYRRIPQAAAIAMARSSRLEGRIAAIVDLSRARRLRPKTAIAVLVVIGGLVLCCVGRKAETGTAKAGISSSLRERQLGQLRSFAIAKEKQSLKLAANAGETISPEFRRFFDAATNGDWQTVTNMYESFKHRHPQYGHSTNAADLQLRTAYWSPVLELCLAYDHVANCEPKYTGLMADGIIGSIPPGSIYFGGTDPGRGVPTAFSKAHAEGEPFFTITQNALADGTYLDYLRAMYGGKIYTPTAEDSQRCFNEYLADAQKRLRHDLQFTNEPKQVKAGEDIRTDENNRVTVQGQVAVMTINGLITKVIFDRNPTNEFFIEESFPLDWMYPHLEPNGLIMKINREPLAELPEEAVTRDREYWSHLVAEMLGDWLKEETPVRDVTAFVDKVYVHNTAATKTPDDELLRAVERVVVRADLKGFTGDLRFIQNDYAKRLFSKLRSSLGGVYAWRADHSADLADKERMTRAADLAFRQAFALCPYSPEAVFRYADLLTKLNRLDDALLLAKTCEKLEPDNRQFTGLAQNLKKMKATGAR